MDKIKRLMGKVPGFRTGKTWKMVISAIVHGILILFMAVVLFGQADGACVTTKDVVLDKITSIILYCTLCVVPYVGIFDCLNIREKVNFLKGRPFLFKIILTAALFFSALLLSIISFCIINTQYSQEYKDTKKAAEELRLFAEYEDLLDGDKLCEEMNDEEISRVKTLLVKWENFNDDVKEQYDERKIELEESYNEFMENQKEAGENNASEDKSDSSQKDSSKDKSADNEKSASDDNGTSDNSDGKKSASSDDSAGKSKKYKYSGKKLRSIIEKYMDTSKEKYVNNIKECSPSETYEIIKSILKDYRDINSKSYIRTESERQEQCRKLASLYSTCFPNAEELSYMNKIVELEDKIVAMQEKLKEYSDIEEEVKAIENAEYKTVYIEYVLGTYYDDNIVGKVQKEVDSYKNTDNQRTRYMASTAVYNEYWGYTRGSDEFIVEAADKFDKAGAYEVVMMRNGDIEIIDSSGFERKIPLYTELQVYYAEDGYKVEVRSRYSQSIQLKNEMDYVTAELNDMLA